MLRSYGRLIRSLSVQPLRYASTTTLKPKTSEHIPKEEDEESVPTKTPRKNANKVETQDNDGNPKGLSELQASLEALGYGKRRKARAKRTPKDEAADASTPMTLAEALTQRAKPTRSRKKSCPPEDLPPRLLPPVTQKHHDLPSFLAYTDATNLNINSTVYRGTHFEYTVAHTLRSFAFMLQRTGRSNDLGIDLVGHWMLPPSTAQKPRECKGKAKEAGRTMPVLVQCKASKLTPAMVRELEGAYVGAPAGWRGEGVLGVLVSTTPATKGVQAAVQRSRWPLCVMQISREGAVRQVVWNAVAAEAGLEGVGVAAKYHDAPTEGDGEEGVQQSISLMWMGKPWRPLEEVEKDGNTKRAMKKNNKNCEDTVTDVSETRSVEKKGDLMVSDIEPRIPEPRTADEAFT